MFFRILQRKMSVNVANRLLNNAELAERRLAELKSALQEVRKTKIEQKIQDLSFENGVLSDKVQKAKSELIALEKLHGKVQYPIPGKGVTSSQPESQPTTVKAEEQEPSSKKGKETKKPKEKAASVTPVADSVIDVRKLDFRIGKIVEINKHPDADSLYVEKIDCGEDTPRTVVSGLVNHVPIDEMRDRIVMVLCNLKPVKMRGVTSEAMVMCASSPEKVEVLVPPKGAAPGDLVSCEGFPREPEAQLNPKKKIFETCAPDLKTNDNRVACYKESPLIVPGKGPIVAPSLKGVQVK